MLAPNFLDGLVRVVAKDGSVWWVSPANVEFYRQLESAKLPR